MSHKQKHQWINGVLSMDPVAAESAQRNLQGTFDRSTNGDSVSRYEGVNQFGNEGGPADEAKNRS
jgi:hypothetical protein